MRIATVVALALSIIACSPEQPPSKSAETPPASAPAIAASPFSGTTWMFIEYQSNDDSIGTVRPDDPKKYTMTLNADGKAAFQLNCNRGFATWAAQPGSGNSGGFTFGPMGMTKMRCPPPSLDTQIAKDTEYVRSYVLEGERLHLSLMADGGIYVWQKTP